MVVGAPWKRKSMRECICIDNVGARIVSFVRLHQKCWILDDAHNIPEAKQFTNWRDSNVLYDFGTKATCCVVGFVVVSVRRAIESSGKYLVANARYSYNSREHEIHPNSLQHHVLYRAQRERLYSASLGCGNTAYSRVTKRLYTCELQVYILYKSTHMDVTQ